MLTLEADMTVGDRQDDYPGPRFERGEQMRAHAEATDASLLVTDFRVLVARNSLLAVALPFSGLRRVEFDIGRGRPGTLILVPFFPGDEPLALSVPADQYDAVGRVLAIIGEQFAHLT